LASRYAVRFIWSKDRFALSRPILYHTNQAELVYDAFLGSGTTLVAAEFTERACLGLEVDPRYCDVIIQRWKNLRAKQSTLSQLDATRDAIKELTNK